MTFLIMNAAANRGLLLLELRCEEQLAIFPIFFCVLSRQKKEIKEEE